LLVTVTIIIIISKPTFLSLVRKTAGALGFANEEIEEKNEEEDDMPHLLSKGLLNNYC
jgi:hypothetical protein